MRTGIVLCALLVFQGLAADVANAQGRAEVVEARSAGPYAQIETTATSEVLAEFRSPDPSIRDAALQKALDQPQNYAPPAHYAAAASLMERQRPEDAIFWFYVAHMRAVNDALILTDTTAASGVDSLRASYGDAILQYAESVPEVWWRQASAAVDWERRNAPDYDRRWLALHGMRAMRYSLAADGGTVFEEITVPVEQWEDIGESNRQRMLEIVRAAIAESGGVVDAAR